MREITLDFAGLQHRRDVHELIAEKLAFPDYYGKNLDALHDCLTDLTEDITLTVTGLDDSEEGLGRWAKSLCRVLRDAAEENSHLNLIIE